MYGHVLLWGQIIHNKQQFATKVSKTKINIITYLPIGYYIISLIVLEMCIISM